VKKTVVLIIENDPVLRELNELILTDAGYEVALVPLNADPVALAEQSHPDVIVVNVVPFGHQNLDLLNRLQALTTTQTIPVVVISTTERSAVEARVAPNVSETIVAPFDIDALRSAVAQALGNPPAAALLPEPYQVAAPALAEAANVLTQNSRPIILRVLRQIQEAEPFKSRFGELSAGLIDNVPKIFGTITTAMQRGLSPGQITSGPEIRQVICEHVRLRESQGLRPAPVIAEYQTLRQVILQFLRGQAGQANLSATDAFDVALTINALVDVIVEVAVENFSLRST
jgi:DNA-binding response OmpR family regulator